VAVNYGLANYPDGRRIVNLPVMEGASWSTMLNKPDELGCKVDMRDPAVRKLDIPSSTELKKTVLFAESDNGAILSWGVISGRTWDNDERTLDITASGAGQYFNQRIIAPPAAATGEIVAADGTVSSDYDTEVNDVTLGSIGVALVAQALSWPGSPTAYILPDLIPDPGRLSGVYKLVDYKKVQAALSDLTKRADGGPDFAFDARRDETGLSLQYLMRAGNPFLGTWAGSWAVDAPETPISGLKIDDDGGSIATNIWMQAGRTDSKVLVSRATNQELLDAGYPVLDLVDTSHNDVTLQGTLDDYTAENALIASRPLRDIPFNVKGNPVATNGARLGPALGEYRPGDWMALDVGRDNLYLPEGRIGIRITSISGDETGETVKIKCDVGVKP
jgi:hypothetical protein